MGILELTDRTFEPAIAEHPVLVVGFWSGACARCQSITAAFAQAAANRTDVTLAHLDPSAYPDVAASFRLATLPTVVVFRELLLVYAQAGPLSPQALEVIITKVLEMDLDGVRAAVEAERAAYA